MNVCSENNKSPPPLEAKGKAIWKTTGFSVWARPFNVAIAGFIE